MITPRFMRLTVAIGLALAALPMASHAAKHAKKPVPAHKADPNETFIRQAYAYQGSGVEQLDVNKAYEYTSDDFVGIGKNGQSATKAQCIALLYSVFKKVAEYHGTFRFRQTIKRIDISGTTAVVLVGLHMWCQVPDQDPSKLPHTVDLSGGTDRDTWVRTATGWTVQKTEWVSDHE